MNKERIYYLYQGYRRKALNYSELREFLTIIDSRDGRTEVEKLADADWETHSITGAASDVDWDFMYNKIVAQPGRVVPMPRRRKLYNWLSVAAILLLIAFVSLLLWTGKKEGVPVAKESPSEENILLSTDIMPASDAVVLTLSNGQRVVLDSVGNGVLLNDSGNQVMKENGGLTYASEIPSEATPVWNTVSTPKGRQFSLVLADGTRIWLNAASTVKYPVAFTGKDRRIEISGEAFLEVAHDPAHPFIAMVNSMEVEVLGTQFNVNAYADESDIRTTLVEGKVLVRKGAREVKLMPGQQVSVNQAGNGPFTVLKGVDTDKVLAWKQGLFYFDQADIRSILREFSRWYDIDVIFTGNIPDNRYFVIMNRSSRLSSVLQALKATDLLFKIEGNKLIVQAADKN